MNSQNVGNPNGTTTEAQEKTASSTSSTKPPSLLFSKRLLVVIMMFLCFMNTIFIRFNITIAIVDMTYVEIIEDANTTTTRLPQFDWDTKTIGLVLSIFYYGGLISFMCGYLSSKLGGAVNCALSMLLSGFLTAIHPACLYYCGFYTFLACRALTGVFECFTLISILEVCSKWMPRSEKSKLMSFVVNGINVGVAVVHSFCAFLAKGWGWPMIFYVTGVISMVMSIVCFILVRNHPSEDRWISEKELTYIQRETTAVSRRKVVHPYKSILTSPPVWAYLTCRFIYMWVINLLIASFPLYVKDTTGESITNVGMISSLPNTVSIFTTPICGILLDYGTTLNISMTLLHKIVIVGSFLIGGVLFLSSAVISIFIVSLISYAVIQVTYSIVSLVSQIIAINLAPDSSGVIAGLGTFAFSLSSIAVRIITGFMTTNHSLEEWNNCFILTSGIAFFGAVVHMLYGSSEAQPWSSSSLDVIIDDRRRISDTNLRETVQQK